MFSRLWKKVAGKPFGYRGRRRASRGSLAGVLQHAKNQGLAPKTIIDIGAAYGQFALRCRSVFPDAKYVLIEPLEEYAPFLEEVVATIPTAEYVRAAAASQQGQITINVHRDLVGSSLYLEQEDSSVNGVPRTVPTVTIDGLIHERKWHPPFLIKVDVQGAELDVLAGAKEALRSSEYVLLEVSFFEFFKDGPQFHDVIAFMKSQGFVTYDIYGLQHRPLDNALSQADLAFVRERGSFRERHYYATQEQREQQDRSLKSPRKTT
jgi:FkbM family methyltransferase